MPIITMLVMRRSGSLRSVAVGAASRPAVAGDHHLADDLVSGQVAHQLLGAGVAEAAVQRAAHLGGDAQRAAVGFRDVDGLEFDGPPRRSAAAICGCRLRNLLGDDLGPLEGEVLPRAPRANPSTTLLMASKTSAVEIDPVPKLLHAHLALPLRHAGSRPASGQLRAREPDQRRFSPARRSARAAASRRERARQHPPAGWRSCGAVIVNPNRGKALDGEPYADNAWGIDRSSTPRADIRRSLRYQAKSSMSGRVFGVRHGTPAAQEAAGTRFICILTCSPGRCGRGPGRGL